MRAWILQANPRHYRIDEALAALKVIHWRVPQHTGEIQTGDVVVIWRAGKDAGIVGVGRVIGPPREMEAPQEENSFALREVEGGTATQAPIKVAPAPFLPKQVVTTLSEFTDHAILTGPMGTVFPLTDPQWQALAGRLPDPPVWESGSEDGRTSNLPEAFAWADRYKAVYPLPGRTDEWLVTLNAILGHVVDTQPEREDLEAWLASRFNVAASGVSNTVNFLQRISLLRTTAARVGLTDEGQRWVNEQDPRFLLAHVHSRVRFIGELLSELREPRSIDELLSVANELYGMRWSTRAQVDRRNYLLQALGAIDITEEGRLVLSAFGHDALSALTLQQQLRADRLPAGRARGPLQPDTAGTAALPVGHQGHGAELCVEAAAAGKGLVTSQRGAALGAPAEAGEVLPADLTIRATAIVAAVEHGARDSTNPDRFERAVADAFTFLGFEATWFGRAGTTDVLLAAELGPQEQYRVIVDTKTTGRGAVSDGHIDWVTLDEHKEKYDADYVVLVASAFQGQRLMDRARRDRFVTLLDVPALVGLVRQHMQAPLGLDAYRRLFEPDGGPEAVAEIAEETQHWFTLASRLVRLIGELEGEEGAMTAEALYWNVRSLEERPHRDEITQVLDALAAPPLGLFRHASGGYLSLGAPQTTVMRLRLLADLIEGAETSS